MNRDHLQHGDSNRYVSPGNVDARQMFPKWPTCDRVGLESQELCASIHSEGCPKKGTRCCGRLGQRPNANVEGKEDSKCANNSAECPAPKARIHFLAAPEEKSQQGDGECHPIHDHRDCLRGRGRQVTYPTEYICTLM